VESLTAIAKLGVRWLTRLVHGLISGFFLARASSSDLQVWTRFHPFPHQDPLFPLPIPFCSPQVLLVPVLETEFARLADSLMDRHRDIVVAPADIPVDTNLDIVAGTQAVL
jgi:hypothetical protein